MTLTLLATCTTLYNGTNTTFADFADCGLWSMFGLDYTAFGFVALAGLAFLSYYFRLDSRVALLSGFTIVYMFDLLAGGSQYLQIAMLLLGIGMALAIATGLMSNVKEYT